MYKFLKVSLFFYKSKTILFLDPKLLFFKNKLTKTS